jgi:hypothetical protein
MKHFPICGICLNEQTYINIKLIFFIDRKFLLIYFIKKNRDSSNELVSCDSCGFYTHEGCYGIADSESKMTTDSSASTEPWFCDACLHREQLETKTISPAADTTYKTPMRCFSRPCELCPNVECGLMKETENGRLVYLKFLTEFLKFN